MKARAWISKSGMLALFASTCLIVWVHWESNSPQNAWLINEPERFIADFDLDKQLVVTFHLRNTGRKPLRIIGTSVC